MAVEYLAELRDATPAAGISYVRTTASGVTLVADWALATTWPDPGDAWEHAAAAGREFGMAFGVVERGGRAAKGGRRKERDRARVEERKAWKAARKAAGVEAAARAKIETGHTLSHLDRFRARRRSDTTKEAAP
jgi:hypothetical protein